MYEGCQNCRTLSDVLNELPENVRAELRAISVNGTSGTALLCDSETGEVFTPPKPYYEAQSQECIALAKEIAPKEHMTTTSTSVLCKLISWHLDKVWQKVRPPNLHPGIDWIAPGPPGCHNPLSHLRQQMWQISKTFLVMPKTLS